MGEISQAIYTDLHFGVHTTVDATPMYQAVPGQASTCGWKVNLPSWNQLPNNFVSAMSQYAAADYYYNVHGKAYYWEDSGDQATNSLETVDLFMGFTHGQAGPRGAIEGVCLPDSDPADSTAHATWAMWDYHSHARSDYMRLGDEARGLTLFVTYSCDTMVWDSNTWNRWHSIFAGGLRMSAGFFGETWWCAYIACPAQYQHGATFANYLGAGANVNWAWLMAFDDNDGWAFSPMVFASGNSDSDCAYRRDNMNFSNFRDAAFSRRRDSQVYELCGRYWSNAD